MDNAYSYDKVDNILSIVGSVSPNAEIGARSEHHYQYDDLYRLTSARGVSRDTVSYSLAMAYNRMSSPTHKNLQVFVDENVAFVLCVKKITDDWRVCAKRKQNPYRSSDEFFSLRAFLLALA